MRGCKVLGENGLFQPDESALISARGGRVSHERNCFTESSLNVRGLCAQKTFR